MSWPRFPRTVNEKAARVVAGGVALTGVVTLATGAWWLLLPLAYGFLARVAAGPTFSPLAQLATRVVAPRLGAPKPVPGPPKRFAQAIGAGLTTAAAVAALTLGAQDVAAGLVVALVVAASLEAVLAICLGCQAFALLIRTGLVPDAVCADCADLSSRFGVAPTAARP